MLQAPWVDGVWGRAASRGGEWPLLTCAPLCGHFFLAVDSCKGPLCGDKASCRRAGGRRGAWNAPPKHALAADWGSAFPPPRGARCAEGTTRASGGGDKKLRREVGQCACGESVVPLPCLPEGRGSAPDPTAPFGGDGGAEGCVVRRPRRLLSPLGGSSPRAAPWHPPCPTSWGSRACLSLPPPSPCPPPGSGGPEGKAGCRGPVLSRVTHPQQPSCWPEQIGLRPALGLDLRAPRLRQGHRGPRGPGVWGGDFSGLG